MFFKPKYVLTQSGFLKQGFMFPPECDLGGNGFWPCANRLGAENWEKELALSF